MTILMIACSGQAYRLMKRLEDKFKQESPDSLIICRVKCAALPDVTQEQSLTEIVGEWFDKTDAIVFLSAVGIAVRSIAPYLRHKAKDPGVVVVDETGKFSISLLSGHAGGANAMAEQIGEMLGAVVVITTATDREGKFAVDDFARKNGLTITDWKAAKEISAAILNGERISICSELPVEGDVPEEIYFNSSPQISISCHRPDKEQTGSVLWLIPRIIVAGIGCRRDTPEKKIAFAVKQCLQEENLLPEAVFAVASIDLKKQEPGLLAYCAGKGLPFLTYPAEILKAVEGEFEASAFVEQVTGVSNVCERSAAAAAEGGRLLCKKKVYDGVTIALAQIERRITF